MYYLVGIRRDPYGENYCYGVLIAPKYVLTTGCPQEYSHFLFFKNPYSRYAVIGSRFNSGVQNDGSERIVISSGGGGYREFPKYSTTGYRAVSIYELDVASTRTPVALPDKEVVRLLAGTTLTTYGWVNENNEHLLSERKVDFVSSNTCVTRNIWFQTPSALWRGWQTTAAISSMEAL